ncbi:Uncharacterized protein TCAP_04438 [Tolypocladium capitatum]|uniref:Uncharacterized protein n=1 Tax=Tolypocladium capitatum TaxID=45235 RepID=A0A2K3QDM4_9HYPO|nr:Uncharacterized protein TCAP_04438 [Tolypocladium capitatum]
MRICTTILPIQICRAIRAAGSTQRAEPVIWDGNFPFGYNSLTEVTPPSVFYDPEATPASVRTALALERYEQGLQAGISMFMFNPQLLGRFALESTLGPEYSQNAIRPIMKSIVVRSTMFTEVLLPDGETTSIGKDMPDMVVTTVELSSRSGENRANVMSFIDKAQSQMFIKAKDVGLSRNAWLGISATPATNTARDYLGYMEVIWDRDYPFSHAGMHDLASTEDLYDPEGWKAWKEGSELYSLHEVDLGRDYENEHDAKKAVAVAERYREGLHRRIPMYMFSPELLKQYALDTKLSAEFSRRAIRPIVQALMLRRTMFTEVQLPDGSVTSMGNDMPDMTVRTVDLAGRTGSMRAKVMTFIEKAEPDIHQGEVGPGHQPWGRQGGAPTSSYDIRQHLATTRTGIDLATYGDDSAWRLRVSISGVQASQHCTPQTCAMSIVSGTVLAAAAPTSRAIRSRGVVWWRPSDLHHDAGAGNMARLHIPEWERKTPVCAHDSKGKPDSDAHADQRICIAGNPLP